MCGVPEHHQAIHGLPNDGDVYHRHYLSRLSFPRTVILRQGVCVLEADRSPRENNFGCCCQGIHWREAHHFCHFMDQRTMLEQECEERCKDDDLDSPHKHDRA